MGGGDWMPLATVMIGLHQAGHSVRCFADPTIARDCAWAGVPFDVVPEDETLPAYFVRWQAAGATGPSPLLPWAKAHLALIRSLVAEFRPEVVLSQLCTAELARLIRTECGLRWCCVNSTFYFGPGSRRPFEADFADTPVRPIVQQFMDAIREADLVLHATDALFDPPPPSIPPHHHHVGPLLWEQPASVPAYLDVPGPRWVLATLSSLPQDDELILARVILQTLAKRPVRVVLTLPAERLRADLGSVPTNTKIEPFVPHAEVLKRGCLLVSHAGHGVVIKALWHGVPMVLVPWDRDQPGVAARAAALGAAEVADRQNLTPAHLAAAVETVLNTPRYRNVAQHIAAQLQRRDPVAIARARIEEFLDYARRR
jgi:UDP-glucoronosyl and UDP-glucosyl transferase